MNPVDGIALAASTALWLTALLAAGSTLVALALPNLAPGAERALTRQAISAAALGGIAVGVFVLAQVMLLDGRFGWPDPVMFDMVLTSPQGWRAALIAAGLAAVFVAMIGFTRQGTGDRGHSTATALARPSRPATRTVASSTTNGRDQPPAVLGGAARSWPRYVLQPLIRRILPMALALLGAALILAGFAQTGHTVREPRLLLALNVMIHLAAVAFWLASLWPLHRAVQAQPPDVMSLRRFGRIAGVTVVLLVVAGFALIGWLAGAALTTTPLDADEIWTSQWLRWLTLKLVLVAALLGLAAANRWWWVPQLAVAIDAGGRAPRGRPSRALGALRASITLEAILFLLILLVTAAMLTHPPPGSGAG